MEISMIAKSFYNLKKPILNSSSHKKTLNKKQTEIIAK